MIQLPVEPKLTEYLYKKAAMTRTPISLSFELTPVCNMACRMCYVRMDRKTQESIAPLRTAEEWLSLAKEAREKGLLYLLLTGGEPFLYPELRKLLEGLHELGLVISINTNGTMIDEQTVEWLRHTPPSRLNITLYGSSDKTYERLCGKADGFTRVTHAIHILREAGMQVKINVSVTPWNADDLDEIFSFCKRENLLITPTSYMFPPLRRDSASFGRNNRFTPEDAAYWSARIISLLNGEKEYLQRFDSGKLTSLPCESLEECERNCEGEGDGIRCRAGKCTGWVTWEGRLLMCGMIPDESAPRVFEGDFAEAWERVVRQANVIRLPAACRDCSIKEECKACAAMVYTESGDYAKVPDYRCRMAHAFPAQAAKLAEEIRSKGDSVDG